MKYIYFDSCCFISYLSGDQNGEKLKGVIKAAAEQKVRITGIMSITYAERTSAAGRSSKHNPSA